MSYSPQYPPPYSPPPVYVQPTETSTTAVISLIAGILGWLGLFGLGGLVAVICGHMAKNSINASGGRITGGGMATAGLILGYSNLALALIGVCCVILYFVGALAFLGLSIPQFNSSIITIFLS